MLTNSFVIFISLTFGSFAIYQINNFANELSDILLMRILRKRIEATLHGKFHSKNDIDILAKSMGFNVKVSHKICLKIQSKIIEGKLPELDNKKDIIDGIITEYEKSQPFEDLPEDIKYNLISIKNNYNGNADDIERLNLNIKSIIDLNNFESKKQKYINYISLMIGAISFGFAIYTQFSK